MSCIAESDDGGGAISGLVAVLVVALLVCAFIGMAVGNSKGRGGLGFLLGLVFGVFGLIVIAVLGPTPEAQARRDLQVAAAARALDSSERLRPCPWCSELIQPAARVCRYCRRDVALPPPPHETAEAWLPDPSGRHPDRWWNGSQWTQWVRDKPGGTRSEDPPLPSTS